MAMMISSILQKRTHNAATAFTALHDMNCNYPDNYYGDQVCVPHKRAALDKDEAGS